MIKHIVFVIKTALYMCNVIESGNNYKSLRKKDDRWL